MGRSSELRSAEQPGRLLVGAGATAAMINGNEGPVEGAVEEVIERASGIPGAGPMIDQAQNFLEDPSSNIDAAVDTVRDTVFGEDFSNAMWGRRC